MPTEFLDDLIDHKRRVAGYMQVIANDLFLRAAVHDNSKFSNEEFFLYAQMFPELQQHAYGSEGFKAAIQKMKPAVAHHYANNDHHPEFSGDGIGAMNLVQLIEMVCDWIAASERSQADFIDGLAMNKKRFEIGEQLFQVLCNTVRVYMPESIKQEPDPNTLYPEVLR